MYVQPNLGEFTVPDGDDWPLRISYRPEPPVVIRGLMNPWEQERKRALYLAEEQAWAKIKTLQTEYRYWQKDYNAQVKRASELLGEIENVTGKKGLARIADNKAFGYASSAIIATNPYGTAIAIALQAAKFLEMGFKILSGEAKRRKKRAKELTDALQRVSDNIDADAAKMNEVAQQIWGLTHAREQATSDRNAIEAQDRAANASQIQIREATERSQAATYASYVNALRQKAGKKQDYGSL